jgi:hypothetical protein
LFLLRFRLHGLCLVRSPGRRSGRILKTGIRRENVLAIDPAALFLRGQSGDVNLIDERSEPFHKTQRLIFNGARLSRGKRIGRVGVKKSATRLEKMESDVCGHFSVGLAAKHDVTAGLLKHHFRCCDLVVVHGKKDLHEVFLPEPDGRYVLIDGEHDIKKPKMPSQPVCHSERSEESGHSCRCQPPFMEPARSQILHGVYPETLRI